jgi:hypothetical protein
MGNTHLLSLMQANDTDQRAAQHTQNATDEHQQPSTRQAGAGLSSAVGELHRQLSRAGITQRHTMASHGCVFIRMVQMLQRRALFYKRAVGWAPNGLQFTVCSAMRSQVRLEERGGVTPRGGGRKGPRCGPGLRAYLLLAPAVLKEEIDWRRGGAGAVSGRFSVVQDLECMYVGKGGRKIDARALTSSLSAQSCWLAFEQAGKKLTPPPPELDDAEAEAEAKLLPPP